MNKRILAGLLWVLCGAAGLTLSEATCVAQGQARNFGGRDIVGTVVGVGGRFGGRKSPVRLVVENYTLPDEVLRCNAS